MSEGGGITLNYLMEMAEKVQYQAALAVTGAWQGSDRVKLYEELGWESLTDRRLYRRILQFHKILDGETPAYLREKLPPNRNSLLNLPNVFQELRIGTQRYLNSIFFGISDVTKGWGVWGGVAPPHFWKCPSDLSEFWQNFYLIVGILM